MKKHLIPYLTAVILSIGFLGAPGLVYAKTGATAQEKILSETVEYFEDGSYLTVTVTEKPSALARSAAYSVSGSKYYAYRANDNTEHWRFTVHGTFAVNSGISSACTESSYSYSISDDAWELESASSGSSGNQAIGEATFVRKLLLFTLESRDCGVVLTCDANGNLF